MIPLPFLTVGQKAAAWALAALLIFIAGAWSGGKLVGNHYRAKEVARLEAEQKEYVRLAGIAQELGKALAEETRRRQDDARTHRTEVQKWRNHGSVQVECPAQGLRLVVPSAVRFGDDVAALWNDGLCLGLSKTSGACRPDGAPVGTDLATPDTLLNNAADNAEACNADRARLRAAQKYLTEIGGAK